MKRSRSPARRSRSPAQRYAAAAVAPPPPPPDTFRSIVFRLGGQLIADIFVQLFLLVATIVLLPTWRLPRVVSIYRRGTRSQDLPAELAELILDLIFGVPALLVVLLTIYRIPLVFKETARGFRASLTHHAKNALQDIGAVLCAAFVYLTLWRIRCDMFY